MIELWDRLDDLSWEKLSCALKKTVEFKQAGSPNVAVWMEEPSKGSM